MRMIRFFDQLHLVVGSIVLALKPLSRASLSEILEMTPESIWNILTHLHSVLIVQNLNRNRYESFTNHLRFYYWQRTMSGWEISNWCPRSAFGIWHSLFEGDEDEIDENICRYSICDEQWRLSSCSAGEIHWNSASYACSSWAKHLQLSSTAGDDTGIAIKLVNDSPAEHLLSWLRLSPEAGNDSSTVLTLVKDFFYRIIYSHGWSTKHRGNFTFRNLLFSWFEIWLTNVSIFILTTLRYCLLQIKVPSRFIDLIDDCERFVLRSFDAMEQSAMHIYHPIELAPILSLTRKLYAHELRTETKLLNAVVLLGMLASE